MTARPAFPPADYREDLRILVRRGLSVSAAARKLGMSTATAYRILKDGDE